MNVYKFQQNKAASIIEYVVLTMLIIGALYTMNNRLIGGFGARYKSTGETFGYGRQFDAKRTIQCKQDVAVDPLTGQPQFDFVGGVNVPKMGPWYDENCFATNALRPPIMETDAVTGKVYFNTKKGGCPQCYPRDVDCFNCEDAIKLSCSVRSDFCTTHAND